MRPNELKTVFLSTSADFFTGMATAWAFAAVDSLNHLAWLDLLKVKNCLCSIFMI